MLNTTDVISLIGGQSVILLGLSAWLGKVWANRISRKEQLKIQIEIAEVKSAIESKLAALNSENESKVHVSKIQYEREFTNYARIWDLVSPISHQFQILFGQKQSYEFYKEEFFKLGTMKSELGKEISAMYPFIDESIYEYASECTQVIQKRWKKIEQHLYFLEDKANQKHTESESKLVEEAIGNSH